LPEINRQSSDSLAATGSTPEIRNLIVAGFPNPKSALKARPLLSLPAAAGIRHGRNPHFPYGLL
jgi:hypothetical protein